MRDCARALAAERWRSTPLCRAGVIGVEVVRRPLHTTTISAVRVKESVFCTFGPEPVAIQSAPCCRLTVALHGYRPRRCTQTKGANACWSIKERAPGSMRTPSRQLSLPPRLRAGFSTFAQRPSVLRKRRGFLRSLQHAIFSKRE